MFTMQHIKPIRVCLELVYSRYEQSVFFKRNSLAIARKKNKVWNKKTRTYLHNIKFKYTLTAFVFCFFIWGQIMEAQKISADDLYQNFGYKSSIALYENKEKLSLDDMVKIANAYRLNHDTENAEFWYAQVAHKSKDPLHTLHYAQMLQSNGRFEEAKENYLAYHELIGGNEASNDQRGALLAASIDRMNEFQHTEVTIRNEALINTDKLDFSPAYYKDGIIFVSTRTAQGQDKNLKDKWINDNFMALFHANKNLDGTLESVQDFSLDLTTRYHEGPICFTKDAKKIYFTRNHYNNKKRKNNSDGVMKLQIYSATKEGENWSNPVELPFNTVEYEEAHPALSPDGQKLYFTSDRSGGFGGMDLYVSRFENGEWSVPENLGSNINTPGNEVFPYVHNDGTLYFASNGWGGLGGLDIFSTIKNEEENWRKPTNIGTPFNSRKDDFGFILNIPKTEGYLTSARHGGKGQDDIYSFTMPSDFPVKVAVCAYEGENANRLSDVEFKVIEKFKDGSTASLDNDLLMTLVPTKDQREYVLKVKQMGIDINSDDVVKLYNTNENGLVDVMLKKNRDYLFVATKDGYVLKEEAFDGSVLEGKSMYEFCLPMEKSECMSLNGVVKNKKYGNLIPSAKVTMTNLCTGDDVVVVADENGAFNFPCVPCGCDFIFKGEKVNLREGVNTQNTVGDNCKLGGSVSVEILLSPDEETEKLIATFSGTELKVGAVIELEDIYYDFDKYYIREDAKDELDNVVRLMQQYPSLVIELGSHTDARATDRYNEKLSQNRARAAVDYITSRGIDRNRLVAMGYGERLLKNQCANFVDCPEEEHQRNRRTEIKVLRFDEKDIEVKHLNNEPEKIDRANPTRRFRWD